MVRDIVLLCRILTSHRRVSFLEDCFSCRLTQEGKVYLKTNLVTLQLVLTEKINCNTARKSAEVKAFPATWDRSIKTTTW